jgi:hypothetical protein
MFRYSPTNGNDCTSISFQRLVREIAQDFKSDLRFQHLTAWRAILVPMIKTIYLRSNTNDSSLMQCD